MSNENHDANQYTPKKHESFIFIFELIGTFIFTYAIGCSHQGHIGNSQNFVHCFSLLLSLALAGQISGGYFNSTISVAAYMNKKHKLLLAYLSAQFLGGLLGTGWFWLLTGRMIAGYEHQSTLELSKFIINQVIGSFFFSICVLALTNKFTTRAFKSWQIYITIVASLYLVRKQTQIQDRMTDDTPLNPTASIFFQIGSWIKTQDTMYLEYLWVLIIPSTFGGLIGGLFMYKIYEPLLLFTKFKNYDFDNDCQYQKEGSISTLSKEV